MHYHHMARLLRNNIDMDSDSSRKTDTTVWQACWRSAPLLDGEVVARQCAAIATDWLYATAAWRVPRLLNPHPLLYRYSEIVMAGLERNRPQLDSPTNHI